MNSLKVLNDHQIHINAYNLDLRQIAISGQCFRWYPCNEGCSEFVIVHKDKILHISQNGEDFYLDCSIDEFNEVWARYLDIFTDYSQFVDAAIRTDDGFLRSAAGCCSGLRILRQDPWEMLITFIISQQNNIPRISGIVDRLCRLCGDQIGEYEGVPFYSFPTAQQILDKKNLLSKPIGVGFREKYIIAACEKIINGYDLAALNDLSAQDAINELKTFYGVGDKIANCVSLFGLGNKDAFPRDVWINRIIDEYYGGDFDTSKYVGYSGVIQQYMFLYGRVVSQ